MGRESVEGVPGPGGDAGAVGEAGVVQVVVPDGGDVGGGCVAVVDRLQLAGGVIGVARASGVGGAVAAGILGAEEVADGVVGVRGGAIVGIGGRGEPADGVVAVGGGCAGAVLLFVEASVGPVAVGECGAVGRAMVISWLASS